MGSQMCCSNLVAVGVIAMGVAVTNYSAVLPNLDMPGNAGQQQIEPAGNQSYLHLDMSTRPRREEVRFVCGPWFAALLSFPFWAAAFLIVWYLR